MREDIFKSQVVNRKRVEENTEGEKNGSRVLVTELIWYTKKKKEKKNTRITSEVRCVYEKDI